MNGEVQVELKILKTLLNMHIVPTSLKTVFALKSKELIMILFKMYLAIYSTHFIIFFFEF